MEVVKGGDTVSVAQFLYEMRKEIYGPEMFEPQQQNGEPSVDPVEALGNQKDLFHERVGKNDGKVKGNVALD
jgi:hypothetical protein